MSKKFKVMLTFDVDAETLWTAPDAANDGNNAKRPSMLSLGSYGPQVAIPRILKLLDKHNIKSSFYIPGETVVKYPEMVAEIHKRGHEIGNHGFTHISPDLFLSYQEEVDEYERTNQEIEKIIHKKPKGFRAPSWEFSENTLKIIKEMGFVYDSTMMGADYVSMLEVFGEKSELVEIPINWTLDDAPFWLLSAQNWGAPMSPPSSVYEIWTEEFQYLYDESFDNCFTLTCHPQLIGRPARIKMYERVIEFIKSHENIEFMRCINAAEQYLK